MYKIVGWLIVLVGVNGISLSSIQAVIVNEYKYVMMRWKYSVIVIVLTNSDGVLDSRAYVLGHEGS